MAASHTAIKGTSVSLRKVRRALVSVSDKTGIVELCKGLASHGVELFSTGGTAKKLRTEGKLEVTDVSEYTGSPEILGGRVKSLHPKIHGGILSVRGNDSHDKDMADNGVKPIDMVVVNLYPFSQTLAKGADFDTLMENIDIGGPTMLRAAAKNNAGVTVVTSPSQYDELLEELKKNDGQTSTELRRRFAAAGFLHTAEYDAAISGYFQSYLAGAGAGAKAAESAALQKAYPKNYTPARELKYGCNPHQKPAALCEVDGKKLPFTVLNGNPGYINLLDAANAWQLVLELKEATGLAAAASFKHVSPAGAAVYVPLSDDEVAAYECQGKELTPTAVAYLRARNADPMSSYGDFAALSEVVDEATAKILKAEVSDGIVAPGFEPKALEILSAKKKGKFTVIQADPAYTAPELEFREVFGMGFMQKRNAEVFTKEHLKNVVTKKVAALPDAAQRDLIVGSIAIKYTQSNSVGYAINGQMIGVGAGQQSRVDCVKLAGRKVKVWWLRHHPKVMGLKFAKDVKRQARVNARVRYIEGDFTAEEKVRWAKQFEGGEPEPLTEAEKAEWLTKLAGVCLASDAFFPFRDSIDHASKLGVSFVAQPGGSIMDQGVIDSCEEYGMGMAFSKLRLFHH